MKSKITIHYAPEYSGHIYAQSVGDGVLLDTIVVNTPGLVALLELQAGKHCEQIDGNQRTALYYKAASDFFAKNTSNVLAASFKLSPLATVNFMLSWRDELALSQWDFNADKASERLSALIEIENAFKQSYDTSTDLPARIKAVMQLIREGKTECKSISLILPVKTDYLRPIEAELVQCMEKNGATVTLEETAADSDNNLGKIRRLIVSESPATQDKIPLNENDKSFLIYTFDDEVACNEYMSHTAFDDVNVWIDGNNIEMDNWLSLMAKPVTGSSSVNRLPLQSQMFMTGVNLLSPDLRLENLVAWLTLPKHPMNKFFREKLAQAVASERSYRNATCNEIIEKYINGDYVYLSEEEKKLPEVEQKAIRVKDKASREDKVKTFLPPYAIGSQSGIADQKAFLKALTAWCNMEAHLLSNDNNNIPFCEQLSDVSGKCSAIISLLDAMSVNNVDFETLASWADTINGYTSSSVYTAQQHSRIVIGSPEKMVTPAKKTVWMGMEGNIISPLDCSFLYPSEKSSLQGSHAKIWDDDKANSYHKMRSMRAFTATSDQLIVVVCKRRLGAETEKHPLMVLLESSFSNLDAVTVSPKLKDTDCEKVKKTEDTDPLSIIKINKAGSLTWPDHLSPTVLATLVEYPFDYVMQYLLGIVADSRVEMSDASTMNGIVAHAVIENLFKPTEGEDSASPEEIKARCTEENIASTLNSVLEQNGAQMLQPENKLVKLNFEEDLKRCISRLLAIITENNLKVVACEDHKKAILGLDLPGKNPNQPDLTGQIDMILKDENDKFVVFDFKWTSSKSYHKGLLSTNRSSQLELYKYLLNNEFGKTPGEYCERVAYFLMPKGNLYSHQYFKGNNCEKVPHDNNDDIVLQLKNSVNYRIRQILGGEIESVNASPIADLQYCQDTEKENLFPLKTWEEDGTEYKLANNFSNYGLFNN